MPKFAEDATLEDHQIGHFGFSAVSLDELESTGYTLATLVCDRSGSTGGFQHEMEAAIKASVNALKKHPQADSIMLRLIAFGSTVEEVHGFILLSDIDDLSKYDGVLAPEGMTALFDACVNAAEASANYGKQLMQDRFNANGIMICITDGMNNIGKFSQDADVVHVKKAFDQTRLSESLESFVTILIAVNSSYAGGELKTFHAGAGFTQDMIELADASEATIAKIGQFVSESISSTSQSLGSGGPSTSLSF